MRETSVAATAAGVTIDAGRTQRFADAIWTNYENVAAFVDALKALQPRPRGSSYAMVYRYLKGKAAPPADG